MGISYKVAQWLNNAGHEAVHLSEQDLHTLEDYLIVEKAIAENRIILTADMDFGQILAFTNVHSISVVQFRIVDLSPINIIAKLEFVFNIFSNQLNLEQVIITVQEKKIRLKKLPI